MFQSDREGPTRIFVIDVATRATRRVGAAGNWNDEDPSWSADGRRLTFASTRAGGNNFDIYVMDADGSNLVRLTDHPAPDQDPVWAVDGRSVFFTSERNGRGEIYRVWLNDKRVDRLTSGFSRAIMPAASPDGRYLAFAAQLIMGFRIELIDLTDGSRRSVGTSGGACRPAFAPNSQELAFVHLDSEPSRLEAVTETGRRTLIADQNKWVYYPSYSPDGRYVAFSVSPEHHAGEDWDLAITDAARPGAITVLTSGRGNDRVPEWRPRVQ
ncbi:MAG: PD40 domain-containing protein [Acidobacteria bacterium]|nr:PD40 domain-containing protein [Acidobacteriota bacterium]